MNDIIKTFTVDGGVKSYNSLFDKDIRSAVKTGLNVLKDFPQSRASLLRVMARIPYAVRRRDSLRKQGIVVPPLLIVSATKWCNLRCTGCYAGHHETQKEMTRAQTDKLLDEAVDAGCSVILVAGGEPLIRKEWTEGIAARPGLLGLVFTNGTLLDGAYADWFADNRNLIPLFSIEGDEDETDGRRGRGVSELVTEAMRLLSGRSVPFGLSITTGEHNYKKVANGDFLRPFAGRGCRLAVFTEYVPVDENGNLRVLSEENKRALKEFCLKDLDNMLLIPFPGDEEKFGGCLAAGRGFAHINTSGQLEPCPFASYSDRNVLDVSLLEALSSPLFHKIRENSHLLHEGGEGCALRGNIGF